MPPLVGVAVKFTEPPAHTVVLLAETDTDGTTDALTVMVRELLVAVALLTQDALLVNCKETTSPFTNASVV